MEQGAGPSQKHHDNGHQKAIPSGWRVVFSKQLKHVLDDRGNDEKIPLIDINSQ